MSTRFHGKGKCAVYKITCLKNGKFYIGSTSNHIKRWNNHLIAFENGTNNQRMQEDYDKYGIKEFLFEIIEIVDEDEKFDKEEQYIKFLHPQYNIRDYAQHREFEKVRKWHNENGDVRIGVHINHSYPIDEGIFDNMSQEEKDDYFYSMIEFDRIKKMMIEIDGVEDWE